MGEIKFRSDVGVKLVQHVGGDASVVAAAKVSVEGPESVRRLEGEASSGLIRYLMKMRHGTPFEHASMTFHVEAPIFVWREWHRHRIGFCLAGDTEVYTESICKSGRTLRKRPIAELWRNWHEGVPDSMGRVRLLPSCRNLPCRVADEKTGYFKIGRMSDIVQSGVKEVLGLKTAKGHRLKCSKDHQILTDGGWVKAGELRKGDRIAVCGKVPIPGDQVCPPALRRGIGVWTSMQRKRLIKPTDKCDGCRRDFPRDDLVLDHCVPVVSDILKALDITNLRPYCVNCHRIKTNSEQVLATGRGGVAGVKYVPLTEAGWVVGEEMTYDISMDGPHHNFVANGVVVHNSYNEESARYKTLDPVFYVPDRERPMMKVEGWKPGRPKFLRCESDELHADWCAALMLSYQASYKTYLAGLDLGLDPGLARDCLPVGIYSSCWVTCNPRSLMAFLSLRTHEERAEKVSYPLWEIELAARQCEAEFARLFPITHDAFVEFGRAAP